MRYVSKYTNHPLLNQWLKSLPIDTMVGWVDSYEGSDKGSDELEKHLENEFGKWLKNWNDNKSLWDRISTNV